MSKSALILGLGVAAAAGIGLAVASASNKPAPPGGPLILDLGPDLVVQMEPDGTVSVVGPVTTNRPASQPLVQGLSGPPGLTVDTTVSGQIQYNMVADGVYLIEATVSDGVETVSDTLQITVTASPPPPVVNAGPDQTVPYINGAGVAILPYSITSDLPITGSGWTQDSGPAVVEFSNIAPGETQALFQVPGVYLLRLTATNDAGTVFDLVEVSVQEPGAGVQVITETVLDTNVQLGGNPPTLVNIQPKRIPANTLGVLWVAQANGTGGPPVVQDGARTWDLVGRVGATRWLNLYRSMMTVETNSALAITSPAPSGTAQNNHILHSLLDYAGVDRTGINGAGAIAQIQPVRRGDPKVLVGEVFLAPTSLVGSAVAAAFMFEVANMPATPGAGYTLSGPLAGNASSQVALQAEFRSDFATLANMFFAPDAEGGTHYNAMAFELRRDAAPPPPPPVGPSVTLERDQVVEFPNTARLQYTISGPNPVTKAWIVLAGSPPGMTLADPGLGEATVGFPELGTYTIVLTVTDQVTGLQASADVVVSVVPALSPVPHMSLTTGSKPNNSSQNDADTAVVTIPANILATLVVTSGNVSGGDPVLLDSAGRQWDLAGSIKGTRGLFLYRSMMPVPTTGSVHITSPAGISTGANNLAWAMNGHADLDASGVNGAAAVGQVKPASPGSVQVLGYEVVFNSAPAANSRVTAGFAVQSAALPATAGPGYALLGAAPVISPTVQTEARPDVSDRASMSWTNPSQVLAILVELRRP